MKPKLHRRILIVIGILVITSVACSCGAIDNIISQLPVDLENLDLENLDPEQLATGIAEQLPEELMQVTLSVDELLEEATNPDEALPPAAEDQVFSDLESNMVGLESYRMRIKITVDGQDANGNAVQETTFMVQEVNNPQEQYHLKLDSQLSSGESQVFEIFNFGNDLYFLDPNNEMGMGMPCVAITGDSGMGDEFSPESLSPNELFDQIEGGKLVERGEMVNGVKTDHYQLKNIAMADSTITTERGDIWIAQNGGYIVRFIGDGQGDAVMYGEGITGKMHWEYDLLDVNNVSDIPLPEACRQAAEQGVGNMPVPENATDEAAFGPMLTFNSPDTPDIVAEFYRQEMAALGYTLSEDTSLGGMFMFTFVMGEETISIIITEGENGGSSVILTSEEI